MWKIGEIRAKTVKVAEISQKVREQKVFLHKISHVNIEYEINNIDMKKLKTFKQVNETVNSVK